MSLPKLRLGLILLFMLLALPIAALVWHAYGQLKWEAFHQSRGMAEELSDRINSNFQGIVQQADSRRFADYSFLVVAGDTSAPFLQRSPLSTLPVAKDIPGAIGYFQIDTDGQFSTPLLPVEVTSPQAVGIGEADLKSRELLATQLQEILSRNQLVEEPLERMDELASTVVESELQPITDSGATASQPASQARLAASAPAQTASRKSEQSLNDIDSQQAFDNLKSLGSSLLGGDASAESIADPSGTTSDSTADGVIINNASVPELKLDLRYEELSRERENAEQPAYSSGTVESLAQPRTEADSSTASSGVHADKIADTYRSTRKERNYVPETISNNQSPSIEDSGLSSDDKDSAQSVNGPGNGVSNLVSNSGPVLKQLGGRRITTFESDIDPMEVSLLASGHFVAYRTVWREGQRLIQGVLIDRDVFIDQLVRAPFQQARVSSISGLTLIYQNELLDMFRRSARIRSIASNTELQGALLYRNRMPAPLDELELVFSINQLPPGPGARVLAWVTAALAAVLLGGFYLLYRAGREQITLATQQQDFVSAVSHELKTPLTSIRMYGELLQEGWAPEEKNQQYYAFIQDESERLSRLIDNVLKLARINRNELSLDMQSISMVDLMASVQGNLQQQAGHSGFDVQFKVDVSAEKALVVVDKDSVMQIMVNLLDNAIKFSRHAKDKRIEIAARGQTEGKVLMSVRDFGPGIPKDQLTKIFRMFYRSENELTRETVGTGIGLAIVNQLCAAMDSDVDVFNREPGAEFLIVFPTAAESKA